MDTMQDYIKSKSNVALLRAFAVKKFKLEKPDASQELILNSFDLVSEDIIEQEIEKVSHWTPNTENIAQININIWNTIKPKIKSILDSRSIDPQKKINELFDSSMSRAIFSQESEAQAIEREAIQIKKIN